MELPFKDVSASYLFIFIKQENQKHEEDGQNAGCASQGGSEEFVCTIQEKKELFLNFLILYSVRTYSF